MVFAGIYPVEADDYSDLREALDKLQLNDASLTFQPETSQALGFGFRAGFLGLFHMEIIQERLEREYDLDVLFTAPSVEYEVVLTRRRSDDGRLARRAARPEQASPEIREPWMKIEIITPDRLLSARSWTWSPSGAAIFKQQEYPDAAPRAADYRDPALRDDRGFLRPAEDRAPRAMPRWIINSLEYRAGRPGEAGDPGQRRAGGCAGDDRPPRRMPTTRAAR